jgi:hypothetical protein
MERHVNSVFNRSVSALWLAALAATTAIPIEVVAREVSYEFASSTVLSMRRPTFGLPPPSGALSGRFTYDPDTPANYTIEGEDCDCLGYRQQRVLGFTATFGDITVSADEYVVELFDDLPQQGNQIGDIVNIIYSSDLVPPPTAPLVVNGIPYYEGTLWLTLRYEEGQFNEPNLAELQGLESFVLALAFLSDAGHKSGPPSISAALETISLVPAPTADFDQDGQVDGADLLIWQHGIGESSPGDANRDGVVDAADLAEWQAQFPAAHAQASAVPEPIAQPLVVLVLLSAPRFARK